VADPGVSVRREAASPHEMIVRDTRGVWDGRNPAPVKVFPHGKLSKVQIFARCESVSLSGRPTFPLHGHGSEWLWVVKPLTSSGQSSIQAGSRSHGVRITFFDRQHIGDKFVGDMPLNLRNILGRLRIRAAGSKLKRRKALDNLAWTHFPKLKILLLVIGYSWMFCLPVKELSRRIYIDENALQPGGVRLIDSLHSSPFLTHVRIR
jgi:hypothetical protein